MSALCLLINDFRHLFTLALQLTERENPERLQPFGIPVLRRIKIPLRRESRNGFDFTAKVGRYRPFRNMGIYTSEQGSTDHSVFVGFQIHSVCTVLLLEKEGQDPPAHGPKPKNWRSGKRERLILRWIPVAKCIDATFAER